MVSHWLALRPRRLQLDPLHPQALPSIASSSDGSNDEGEPECAPRAATTDGEAHAAQLSHGGGVSPRESALMLTKSGDTLAAYLESAEQVSVVSHFTCPPSPYNHRPRAGILGAGGVGKCGRCGGATASRCVAGQQRVPWRKPAVVLKGRWRRARCCTRPMRPTKQPPRRGASSPRGACIRAVQRCRE